MAVKELCEVFSQRLMNARKMRQMSQKALADALKGLVSASAIEKYEKGLMIPTSTVLLELERVLGVDSDYFFTPVAVSADFNKFEFRKKSSLGKKKQEAIMVGVSYKLEKYLEIEDITGMKKNFNLRKYRVNCMEDAKEAARKLRGKWCLGTDPIASPIALLESEGVKVIQINEDDKFDGVSITIDGKIMLIVLNANKTEERKRLTEFHEFGHQVLDIAEGLDEEKVCNVFASEMLLPSDKFRDIFNNSRKGISMFELEEVQRVFGISPEAQMLKAHQLGIINDNRYKLFCIRKNQNEALRNALRIERYPKETTNRFKRLVFMALAKDQISFSKAASLLDMGVDEVRQEFNLV